MPMSAGVRRVVLTAHLISSVGWFGAVAAFLVLALTGMVTADPELARAAYLVMGVTTWLVIVPLAVVAFLTGVVAGLGTKWGLCSHYWVLMKLVVTALATLVLLVHTRLIDLLVREARGTALLGGAFHGLQREMVVASGATLVVLTLMTVLSVYKPRGVTPFGAGTERPNERDAGAAID